MFVEVTEENWKKILLCDVLYTSSCITPIIVFIIDYNFFCR